MSEEEEEENPRRVAWQSSTYLLTSVTNKAWNPYGTPLGKSTTATGSAAIGVLELGESFLGYKKANQNERDRQYLPV
ncbi:hypothetical protein PanWU01x14_050430 [Parasponia andersonii]|uniref:Uncharacterized protein n=1 Tax=Parasponia andersonii TaxID=3476 RepID=A0A2P5DLP4_PARAD|nr:hypothetical protein PanWU01x14_050430 [Parasponia andersonii]